VRSKRQPIVQKARVLGQGPDEYYRATAAQCWGRAEKSLALAYKAAIQKSCSATALQALFDEGDFWMAQAWRAEAQERSFQAFILAHTSLQGQSPPNTLSGATRSRRRRPRRASTLNRGLRALKNTSAATGGTR